MKLSLILILIFSSNQTIAQDKDHLFSPKELQEDVNYYLGKLHPKHPNSYDYFSMLQLENLSNKVYMQLEKPLTRDQFSWIVGEIHSYVERHWMKIRILQGCLRNDLWQKTHFGVIRRKFDEPYKIFPDSSMALFYINSFNHSNSENFNTAHYHFSRAVNREKIKYIFYDLSRNTDGISPTRESFLWKRIIHDSILSPNHDQDIPEDRKLFVLQRIRTASHGNYFRKTITEIKLDSFKIKQPTGEFTTDFTMTIPCVMPHTKIPFNIPVEFWDFSSYFNSKTRNGDTNHLRNFSEKELMNIFNHWKKDNVCTN